MQDLIRKITEIFDEVPVARDNISEEERVAHLLASLPNSLGVLVTALESNVELPAMEVDSAFTMKDQMRRSGPRCHYCKKFGHI